MKCRTAIYTRTSGGLKQDLRQKIEAGGNIVVDVFADHEIAGQSRRSHTGRNRLLAALDGIDQIAMASAGDIPAKTVGDLLRLLGILRDHALGFFWWPRISTRWRWSWSNSHRARLSVAGIYRLPESTGHLTHRITERLSVTGSVLSWRQVGRCLLLS
jgi:hypothetical protein